MGRLTFSIKNNSLYINYNDGKSEEDASIKISLDRNKLINVKSVEEGAFDLINMFNETLSEKNKKKVWNAYQMLMDHFLDPFRDEFNTELVKSIAAQIGEVYNYKAVRKWCEESGLILIPDTIAREYVHRKEDNRTQEKTYIADDYFELCVFITASKAFLPYWVLLYREFNEGLGHKDAELYPYLYSVRNGRLEEYPALERFKAYIHSLPLNLAMQKVSELDNFMSEDDYIDYLCAMIFMRFTSILDIRKNSVGERHIVMLIYHRISKFTTSAYNRNYQDTSFREKKSKNDGDDNDSASDLDKYKVKTEFSVARIEEINFITEDIMACAAAMGYPELTPQAVMEFTENDAAARERLLLGIVPESSLIITEWVCRRAIHPKALFYIHKRNLVNLLRLTYLTLRLKGHHLMAAAVDSIVNNEVNSATMSISASEVTPEKAKKLIELYPFKTLQVKRSNRGADINPYYVLEAINILKNRLLDYHLVPVSPVHESVKLDERGNLIIRPNIKTIIADMIIDIY